ncbi:MAG: type II toxin-antitoxin system ParD family antitoxin [Saprospiraceae bacterium]|nr:type II toxin-antitoxin system ParD family antitoxin [Saprospiraceae bacterium]
MQNDVSISLKESTNRALMEKVGKTQYESIDDVILAGLSLIDQENEKIEALRAAIIEGEESGPSVVFDPEDFKKKMHQKHSHLEA